MPDTPNNHDTEPQDVEDEVSLNFIAFSPHANLVWHDSQKHPEAKPDSELLRRIQRGGD